MSRYAAQSCTQASSHNATHSDLAAYTCYKTQTDKRTYKRTKKQTDRRQESNLVHLALKCDIWWQ